MMWFSSCHCKTLQPSSKFRCGLLCWWELPTRRGRLPDHHHQDDDDDGGKSWSKKGTMSGIMPPRRLYAFVDHCPAIPKPAQGDRTSGHPREKATVEAAGSIDHPTLTRMIMTGPEMRRGTVVDFDRKHCLKNNNMHFSNYWSRLTEEGEREPRYHQINIQPRAQIRVHKHRSRLPSHSLFSKVTSGVAFFLSVSSPRRIRGSTRARSPASCGRARGGSVRIRWGSRRT
jgi:hypothetical protein